MIRNMELIRKILLAIEEKYVDVPLDNLKIDGHEMNEIAYHCKLLYSGRLIDYYKSSFAGDKLWIFTVGSLTMEGHDFLDKVRDDSTWGKTVSIMKEKVLPFTIENVKAVASTIAQAALQGLLTNIAKGLL